MCFFGSSPKVDTSYQKAMLKDAERARADEEARKARIKAGTSKIDTEFGKFDDGFFDGYRDQYLGFYQPDIDRQFGDAKDQLTYGLARAGTLNSSIAGDKQGKLLGEYDLQSASTLSKANDARANLQGNVNNEKSSLVSLLNATGDSEMAANGALARSAQLFKAQPSYNPLGDIFGGIANGIGSYNAGRDERDTYDAYFNPGKSAARSGSSRII